MLQLVQVCHILIILKQNLVQYQQVKKGESNMGSGDKHFSLEYEQQIMELHSTYYPWYKRQQKFLVVLKFVFLRGNAKVFTTDQVRLCTSGYQVCLVRLLLLTVSLSEEAKEQQFGLRWTSLLLIVIIKQDLILVKLRIIFGPQHQIVHYNDDVIRVMLIAWVYDGMYDTSWKCNLKQGGAAFVDVIYGLSLLYAYYCLWVLY
eukprot:TRINITY_DN1480_c0_g1_i7.p3 TRINITY_DN1480_c0_g1~~TRINITY_DN1480_c0_g1_i7.p3  ORF type:complete len:203 (-),score=7.57 TRINITY_DN1480_c0_g1_i7:281-889(-)